MGGTLSFFSPERLISCNPTKQSDVFAFGMFLYELHDYGSDYPYERDGIQDKDILKDRIERGILPCHKSMVCSLQKLFRDCCSFSPDGRPAMAEIVCRLQAMESTDFNVLQLHQYKPQFSQSQSQTLSSTL